MKAANDALASAINIHLRKKTLHARLLDGASFT